MVARILSGTSIRGLLNYNEAKVGHGTASLVMASGFGVDIQYLDLPSKQRRFEHLTRLNSKVKTNAVHIMLNFDHADKIKTKQYLEIAEAYMNGIGCAEQPFLVYKHHDTRHAHLHIITTNIRRDGSRMELHNIGRLHSEPIRKEIEHRFKLIRAQGVAEEKSFEKSDIKKAVYGKRDTKSSIYNVVTPVLASYSFSSFAQFNAVLNTFNVCAERGEEDSVMYQKKGLIYSMLGQDGQRIGVAFKASALPRRPTLDKIEGKFISGNNIKKGKKQAIRDTLEEIFSKYDRLQEKTLIKVLKEKEISLLLRKSESNLIYGLTFIDHNQRAVFNGSELGKEWSAKGIAARLGDTDLPVRFLSDTPEKPGFSTNHSFTKMIDDHPANKEHPGLVEVLTQGSGQEETGDFPEKRKKKKRKYTKGQNRQF